MVFQEHREQGHSSLIFKNYLDMSVWQLRHLQVSKYIAKHNIKKTLDIGCSQGHLINRLSRSHKIQLLVGVDIDPVPLAQAKQNVKPELIQDEISYKRESPLFVKLYKADIFSSIPAQANQVELVTLIEVIEHIPESMVPKLCERVFGLINPEHILITTPNADFNHWFNFSQNQMRHPDHKFQWSRNQFETFVKQTAAKFNYEYEIFGVGEHINDGKFGYCSQGASFRRNQIRNKRQFQNGKIEEVISIKYPFWIESLKKDMRQKLTGIIFHNSYSPIKLITELFLTTKMAAKLKECPEYCTQDILQEQDKQLSKKTLEDSIQLDQKFVRKIIENNLKYCFYDEKRDFVFYDYQDSDEIEEEDQFWSDQKEQYEKFMKQMENYPIKSRASRKPSKKNIETMEQELKQEIRAIEEQQW